jgi:hypothetical protein
MPAALSAWILLLTVQAVAPLRKSDVVRLLSGAAMTPVELARLVRRNCLTFVPTERDRTDFQRLGADRTLLDAMNDCGRRPATTRPAPPPPPRPVTVAPAPPPQPRAIPARVSAERSSFVSGGGQRGNAGSQLPRALVFEARDSTGAPLAAQVVTFTGINARIEPGTATTDAAGQARVGVTLGQGVGSATVIAAIGVVEKQVAFNVVAGPAAQLVVSCGASSVAGRFAIRPDSVVTLRVTAQDGYANPTPLLGLRAAVADARIFRVLRVAQDSVVGTVALKPDQPGTTSLAVIANGMRQYLTVTVPPRAAPGNVDCR